VKSTQVIKLGMNYEQALTEVLEFLNVATVITELEFRPTNSGLVCASAKNSDGDILEFPKLCNDDNLKVCLAYAVSSMIKSNMLKVKK